MRAIDCGCGEHLEEADTVALLRATREHIARVHPELKLTDDQVAVLIAVDAYTRWRRRQRLRGHPPSSDERMAATDGPARPPAGKEARMIARTSADTYEYYRRLCDGTPVLTHDELRVEIRAAGLRYEDLDEAFWATILRRPDHRHLC